MLSIAQMDAAGKRGGKKKKIWGENAKTDPIILEKCAENAIINLSVSVSGYFPRLQPLKKGGPAMNVRPYDLSAADRSAYERLPVPMCVIHAEGETHRLLLVSDGLCRLMEGDRAALCALMGEDLLAAVHESDREAIRSAAANALIYPGDESRAACRLRTANGGEKRVVCCGRAEKLEQNTYLLFLFYSDAVNERTAAEKSGMLPAESIAARGAEFAAGQNSELYLISRWRCDLTANRTIDYQTKGPRALTIDPGLSYDQSAAFIAGQPYDAEARARLAALLDRGQLIGRYEKGESTSVLEYRRNENGQMPFWVSLTVSAARAPGGHVECYVSAYDITEKILESQLISRLTMLGYDIVGLIYLQTGKCRFFRIKKMHLGMSFEQYDDYKASIEDDIDRVVGPDRKDEVLRALRLETIVARLGEDMIYSFSYPMTTSDGRHRYKLLQFSYLDERRDTLFLCRSDTTRQHEIEREQFARLREAKLEADRANAAKSMFLSSMSHDLRTPLNGIIGFTNLALHESDPVRKQDYLEKVRSSSGLLLDLVNDTLELSRIESGKFVLTPEAVSLRETAAAVVTALRPSAEIKCLRFDADPAAFPDAAVWVDRLKFQKIFLNLLSNAIKYTPSGGAVAAAIELREPTERGYVCRLTVRDNGIGIGAEFLPHIFDAFSQERRPESANIVGTGLGLSIVKRIVTLMGGRVAVESERGRGSVFTVELPLQRADGALIADRAVPGAEDVLRGKRALLCEDNYLNTEIAKILLEEQGMGVDCADNGELGARRFRESPVGTYDVVLMDIRMPVMDGYEAARRIRSYDRPDAAAVPIIAMTADAFEEDIRNCLEAGMNAHVTKPIDPKKLVGLLREQIAGNSR